jgi:hypothetical protein
LIAKLLRAVLTPIAPTDISPEPEVMARLFVLAGVASMELVVTLPPAVLIVVAAVFKVSAEFKLTLPPEVVIWGAVA